MVETPRNALRNFLLNIYTARAVQVASVERHSTLCQGMKNRPDLTACLSYFVSSAPPIILILPNRRRPRHNICYYRGEPVGRPLAWPPPYAHKVTKPAKEVFAANTMLGVHIFHANVGSVKQALKGNKRFFENLIQQTCSHAWVHILHGSAV